MESANPKGMDVGPSASSGAASSRTSTPSTSLTSSQKSKAIKRQAAASISEAIETLSQTYDSIGLEKQFKEGQTSYHAALNKLQKNTEKAMPPSATDYSHLTPTVPIPNSVLYSLVSEHLLRLGRIDLAESLDSNSASQPSSSSSSSPTKQEKRKQFLKLKQLIDHLRSKNVAPILEWTNIACDPSHSFPSSSISSPSPSSSSSSPSIFGEPSVDMQLDPKAAHQLNYLLHKIHYGKLIIEKKYQEALTYAKIHFVEFVGDYKGEIMKLMGALAFATNLEQSVYNNLFGRQLLIQTEDLLVQSYCKSMGLSTDPHIYTILRASSYAIPKLAKAAALQMASSSSAHNSSNGQSIPATIPTASSAPATPATAVASSMNPPEKLSFEIPLPTSFVYHSLFCCPVSKELSTPKNPPMLLPCGHVISKDIVTELANRRNPRSSHHSSSSTSTDNPHPFKCPYCPEKVQMSQVTQINFG